MNQNTNEYEEIAERAYMEFSNVADYIWKAPRLIEHEEQLELSKLDRYFPDNEEHAKLRWHFESKKLYSVFPFLIAVGNLYTVISLLESYLLLLAQKIETETGKQISTAKGTGINRFFSYLRGAGLYIDAVEYYYSIQAAVKIRNCLLHASGVLSWAKDRTEILRIARSGTFFEKDVLEQRRKTGKSLSEVRIVDTGFGERLQVDNMYAFIVSAYARDFVINLCSEAEKVIGERT